MMLNPDHLLAKIVMKTSRANTSIATLLLGAAIVVFDQVTKQLALTNLYPGERVEVIPNLLWWRLAFNDGAAFSIGSGFTWIFTIISTLAVVTLIVVSGRSKSLRWTILTGMVMGGAAGNLIDRLFRDPGFAIGHVVDFIQLPFNFATFNVADSFLVVGICIASILTFRGEPIGGHARD